MQHMSKDHVVVGNWVVMEMAPQDTFTELTSLKTITIC